MPENISVYTEPYTVRANEVDVNGRTTLSAICNYFQEVAGNHALLLNFDISNLHLQNLTWVLQRLDIKMNKYPEWRDHITIETWPATGDGIRALRNYRILDESGEELGCCLSYWMIMNLETRRPVRLLQYILDFNYDERDKVMEMKTNRLIPPSTPEISKNFNVRKSDLDMNNHVNHIKFIEWMVECLPETDTKTITGLDIVFMNEIVYGDTITSSCGYPKKGKSNHQLINQDNKIISLGEIVTD